MKLNNFKAIIFDLDGTLTNPEFIFFQAMKQTLATKKIKLTKKQYFSVYGSHTIDIIAHFLPYYSEKELHSLLKLNRSIVDALLPKKVVLQKGISKTLFFLSKKFRLVLVTNSRKQVAIDSLKQSAKLFDLILGKFECLEPKPSPKSLLLAAEKLNLKKSQCIYVGDSLKDAVAAKNAQMSFIAVLSTKSKKDFENSKPIAFIKSVNELVKMI